MVYVHLPKRDRTKLEPRAAKCVFLGYGVGQKGYRCFDPLHNKLYTTMDCDFFEHSYYFTQPRSQGESSSEDLSWLIYPLTNGRDPKEQVNDTTVTITETTVLPPTHSISVPEYPAEREVTPSFTDTNNDVISSDNISRRYDFPPRSTRGIPPRRYDPEFESQRSRYPINQENQEHLSQMAVAFNASLYSGNLPKNTDYALSDPKWKKAMEEEILALKRNETWERCILPKGKRIVGCKWVFSIKYHADGTIERYKAWLVAKGYTQTFGVDYSETFSPVAKIDTIRVLFSIAANKDWPLYQFDVKNVFLHGNIEEEVYMQAPPGFLHEYNKGEGCRLRKALYGLTIP